MSYNARKEKLLVFSQLVLNREVEKGFRWQVSVHLI